MTYTKPLKYFIANTLMGTNISVSDTAESREGSYAIEAFENKKIIKSKSGDVEVLVPFHAVKTARWQIGTEDAEKADPYCVGGGIEADCSRTDLGELLYCGSASNAVLEGVDGWRWVESLICGEDQSIACLLGVFDGNVVRGEMLPDNCAVVRFGDYLTTTIQTDDETGDNWVQAGELVGASHYAIYAIRDCDI